MIILESLFLPSDEKDVDVELLGKDLVSAQPLTIVEEEASLSPDGSETIPQGLLDNGDEEITYQLRSGDGRFYLYTNFFFNYFTFFMISQVYMLATLVPFF